MKIYFKFVFYAYAVDLDGVIDIGQVLEHTEPELQEIVTVGISRG